jgi:hypothetical protein
MYFGTCDQHVRGWTLTKTVAWGWNDKLDAEVVLLLELCQMTRDHLTRGLATGMRHEVFFDVCNVHFQPSERPSSTETGSNEYAAGNGRTL